MGVFLQGAAAVLIGVILTQLLSSRDKSYASMLSMGICAMVLLVGIHYLEPVLDFLRELEDLGNLHSETVKILLKATGIGILTEISALLCVDSGNASLAQSLRILSSGGILWLSLPVFQALLNLIQRILEGV
jgi:stage III sporulation protein AD